MQDGHKIGHSLKGQPSDGCASFTEYLTCPVTAFYKGESQEKKLPGDWKEQRFVLGSPAHIMLGGSWGFLFSQIHVVVVTTSAVSDATSSAVAKCQP